MMRSRSIVLVLLAGGLLGLTGCLFSSGPIAAFTITPGPAYGRPPFTRAFDASPSSSPSGIITSYAWDFGNGETDSGKKVSHTFTEKGTYPVTLTVADSAGQTAHAVHSIQVLGLLPAAYFEYSPQGATSQTPVEFDASESQDPDGEIVDWIWSFGDGTADSGMIVEHLFPKVGTTTYDVRLTVIDDDGDSSSMTRKVTIYGCDCG
jgi:PKD repeat protein